MLSQWKENRVRRISGAFGFLGFCLWFTAMYLRQRWYEVLSRSPAGASGNIYPYNFHGIALYLTHRQQTTVQVLEVAAFAFFLVGIVFDIVRRRKFQSQP